MDIHIPEPYAPQVGRSISLEQAARLLNVSRRTIYNRIRDGRLLTIRTLGGSQRVLLTSVATATLQAMRDAQQSAPPERSTAPRAAGTTMIDVLV